MSDLIYDKRTGQYRAKNGQFVSRARVLADVQKVSVRLTTQLERETERLIAGSQSLISWQQRTARMLRESHQQIGVLAAGGKKHLQQNPGDRVK
ncbi:MAG: hypothetical protein HC910_21935 [Spirulinaceae cyanobacterium SM2_1_0]|nr:hypothetical protein [Spirulinaceae cyanobacterium SM2_1_0]